MLSTRRCKCALVRLPRRLLESPPVSALIDSIAGSSEERWVQPSGSQPLLLSSAMFVPFTRCQHWFRARSVWPASCQERKRSSQSTGELLPLTKTIVNPPRLAQVTGNDLTESSDKSNSSVREESNPWHEGELASNYAPYGHLMRSALVRLLATPHKLQRSIVPESDDANADNMLIRCSQRLSCHHMPLSRMQLSLITYHSSCLDPSSLVTVKWQRAIAELRRLSWRAWG